MYASIRPSINAYAYAYALARTKHHHGGNMRLPIQRRRRQLRTQHFYVLTCSPLFRPSSLTSFKFDVLFLCTVPVPVTIAISISSALERFFLGKVDSNKRLGELDTADR